MQHRERCKTLRVNGIGRGDTAYNHLATKYMSQAHVDHRNHVKGLCLKCPLPDCIYRPS